MSQVTAKKSLNISSRDRAQAGHRRAHRRADDRLLADRRVADPLRPEPVEQPLGQLEHAARGADVLADEHDRSGRAPSPARCRRRSACAVASVIGRPTARPSPVGPDLGLEHVGRRLGRRARLGLGRGDLGPRLVVDRVERRPRPRRPPRAAPGRRGIGSRAFHASTSSSAGTCRGRRASGRRGGRSAPRSATGPSPARARSIAVGRDRVDRLDVVAVDDDRLEAVGARPVRRRPRAPP